MKQLVAIILLCLPTQLSAAERCAMSRHHRDEIARVSAPKPPAARVEISRPYKVRPLAAWQRVILFEQQIL